MFLLTLQMRTLSHLLLILTYSSLAALFLGSIKGVEVRPLVVIQSLRMLMDDVGGNLVKKGSVVRYDQYSAGIGREVV